MRRRTWAGALPGLTGVYSVTYGGAVALEEEPVFKALADPTRRLLLDRLFSRDGRSLSDLATDLEMTRFGVMKHLQILEQASLVVTRKSGREKLHFLNVVPIREIYVRWIGKYTEHHAAALVDLKSRLEAMPVTVDTLALAATQVFRIHIKATPEAVWEAITSAEATAQYGFHMPAHYELQPGGTFQALANAGMKTMGAPEVAVEGAVLAVEPRRRLVQTWRMLFEPAQAAEPLTTVTWEIEPLGERVTRLTVTHDLTDAPVQACLLSGEGTGPGEGGWPFVLSDLKSLLETGRALVSER